MKRRVKELLGQFGVLSNLFCLLVVKSLIRAGGRHRLACGKFENLHFSMLSFYSYSVVNIDEATSSSLFSFAHVFGSKPHL